MATAWPALLHILEEVPVCFFPQPRTSLHPGQIGVGISLDSALVSSLFFLPVFLSFQTLPLYQFNPSSDLIKTKSPLSPHFSLPSSPSPFVLPVALPFPRLSVLSSPTFLVSKNFFNEHSLPHSYSHPYPHFLCLHWARMVTAFMVSSGATVLTVTKTDPGRVKSGAH